MGVSWFKWLFLDKASPMTVINYSLTTFHHQFPSLKGYFQHCSLQLCHHSRIGKIILFRLFTFVTTTGSLSLQKAELLVYDSSYNDVDSDTIATFDRLFYLALTYKMAPIHKQRGFLDCGLFAIGYATLVAFGDPLPDPSSLKFNQERLCSYLARCLKENTFISLQY